MTTRVIMYILLAGALAIFARDRFISPVSLCENLTCITIPNRTIFHLKEEYADTADTYRALYESPSSLLRIEAKKTLKQQADQELDGAVSRMKALFEKAPAPYPGEISDAIVCDDRYIPRYTEANGIRYFTGFLNNRLTFGSCSQDQAVYRGIMGFLYCPKSSLLIKLELIAETQEFTSHEKEFTDRINALSCNE
ncbi:MAG: hypothetical protein ACOY3M_06345 [Patescibacteria group bacterium]